MGYYDDLAGYNDAQAVGWRGVWDQAYRYLSVSLLLSELPIVDIGCGRGGLARFLCEHGHLSSYLGFDSFEGHREFAFKHAQVAYRWKAFDASDVPEGSQFVCIGGLVGNDGEGVSLEQLLSLAQTAPVVINGIHQDWLDGRPWSDPALRAIDPADFRGADCEFDPHMPPSDVLVGIGVQRDRELSAQKRLEVLSDFLEPDASAIRLCVELGQSDFGRYLAGEDDDLLQLLEF